MEHLSSFNKKAVILLKLNIVLRWKQTFYYQNTAVEYPKTI